MVTVIGLLRGVNVGGSNRVPMADLRAAAESVGHGDPRTYLNSGNVVFEAADQPSPEMAAALRSAVAARTGVDVPILLRSLDDLVRALGSCPYALDAVEPKFVLIGFASSTPEGSLVDALDPRRFLPDRFTMIGRELHLSYPEGSGRSKMQLGYFEKNLGGITLTTRNLTTVRALVDLAVGPGERTPV